MAVLSVAEALAQVTDGLTPLTSERVSLREVYRRVLAEDIGAKLTQPPFPASAMDGFALKSSDIQSLPIDLKIVGEAAAGHQFEGVVNSGEAVRIFTGAPVPEGCDTVLIQENAVFDKKIVTVKEGAEHGAFIRPRGLDFSEGQLLLTKGQRLNARDLSLAAAMNWNDLPVVRKPCISILATGDELVLPGDEPRPDQIISSIPYGLAALVEMAGGEPHLLGIAEDNKQSLQESIAPARGSDILVTIGGASIGEHDLVQAALAEEGMSLNFWKIAMRPGKPLMFGTLGTMRVLSVPGNPVSAHICARIFLVPMIHRLTGFLGADTQEVSGELGANLPANGPRQHYMRARYGPESEGIRRVIPAESQDSSLMATLAESDCFIIRPPHAPPLVAGATVPILPLDF